MLLKSNKYLIEKLTVIMVLSLLIIGQSNWSADAKEPSKPELTLNQAVSMALGESEALTKAEMLVEKNENTYDDKSKNLDFIPTAPGTAAVESAYAQVLSANLTWQVSQRNLTSEQDKTVIDTCNKYWAVLNAQVKLDSSQASLDNAKVQLTNARALLRVGMLANSDLIGAEAQFEAATASLSSAQNDLSNAYVALNQKIGLWPEDRPVLVETVVYQPLKVDNLDQEVARVLANAPSVWQVEQAVALQRISQNMAFYSGSYTSYENRKIDVEQAELDVVSTQKTYEKLTRNIYYNIVNVEASYAAALQSEKVAEENYRIKEIQLQLGMATQADLTSAKKDLVTAKTTIFNLLCQHANLKLTFEKPWAAS